MNIYQVEKDVFRFRIWNIVTPEEIGLDGQSQLPTFLIGFHGGYGTLTSYPKGNDVPGHPTDSQRAFLEPKIVRELKYARYYNRDDKGVWLFPETQKKSLSGEYIAGSGRTVFDLAYVAEVHGISDEDRKAVELLKDSGGG